MKISVLWKAWKITLIILILIFGLGLFLRLYNLTYLPVFGDEAIYIRWAQIMRNDASLRFLPLSDGKQPLFMWTVMPFLKIFSDPLFAGRIVSIITGFGTGLGIFTLSFVLFRSKKVAVIATLIYLVAPFGYFFDRLAMADSMLSFFGVWAVVFSVVLTKTLRLDIAMMLGFILALALLTKSPALFFSILIPTTWVLITYPKSFKGKFRKLLQLLSYFSVSYVIAYGIYNFLLRLGPNFHMISLRNLDYVFPISHLWQNPKDPFIFHFDRAREWYVIYGTWWLAGLVILGLGKLKKFPKEVFLVFCFFIFPLLIQSMFAKVFTTRYVFFTFPYYAILASLAFYNLEIKKLIGKITVIFLLLLIIQSGYFFYRYHTNLESTPLARTDRSGFLEEWTSGTGIKESADYIIGQYNKDKTNKIVVGTEGYFGTLPDGFAMYTANYPITVIGVGLDLHDIPNSLTESVSSGNKTYLVINSSRLKMDLMDPRLRILASFKKAHRPDFVHEYTQYGLYDTLYLLEIVSSASKTKTS